MIGNDENLEKTMKMHCEKKFQIHFMNFLFCTTCHKVIPY